MSAKMRSFIRGGNRFTAGSGGRHKRQLQDVHPCISTLITCNSSTSSNLEADGGLRVHTGQ